MSRLKYARAHAMHAATQRGIPATVAVVDKRLTVTVPTRGDAWTLAPIICNDPITVDPSGVFLAGRSRLNAVPVRVTANA